MTTPEGAFHRAPRPLILWAGMLFVAGLAVFVLVVLTAIALGFWKTAAQGAPPPDFSGGLQVIAGAAAVVSGIVAQVLGSRSRERRDQIAFGGSAPPPFVPPPISPPPSEPPFEGVNPHGGPGAP